jgi:hypothetical protein
LIGKNLYVIFLPSKYILLVIEEEPAMIEHPVLKVGLEERVEADFGRARRRA